MAVKYSTGAVMFKAGEGGVRQMFSDCVLDIFGGATAPATADEAYTGTKLCRVTVGSNAVTSAQYSTPQKSKLICTDHDPSEIYDIDVTIDSVVHNVLFNTDSLTDHTLVYIARELARQMNLIPGIYAISDGTDTVYAQGNIGGLAFTLADGGGTTTYPTVTTPVAASRASIYTLQFGPPTAAGVISKTADVWSGVNLATGVASYFRFVLAGDDTAIFSATAVRGQGTIATSGSDLNMSNTTLTKDATTTIDTATITIPKS